MKWLSQVAMALYFRGPVYGCDTIWCLQYRGYTRNMWHKQPVTSIHGQPLLWDLKGQPNMTHLPMAGAPVLSVAGTCRIRVMLGICSRRKFKRGQEA